jgi:multidrug efflux pump subunit AcrA (membrane-fusion protein)
MLKSLWKRSRVVTLVIAAGSIVAIAACISACTRTPSEPASSAVGATTGSGAEKTLYTCGMHPEVIQDKPGNCPKCGMKLVRMDPERARMVLAARGEQPPAVAPPASPKESTPVPAQSRRIKYYQSTMMPGEISTKPGQDSMGMEMVPVYEGETEGAAITIDPVTQQNMGIRTGKVTRGPLRRVIRSVGMIDYNETSLTDVTTKFSGWIEKLYADFTGKQVKAGDPLFVVYSPELYKTEFDYLIAARAAAKTPSLGTSVQELAAEKLRLLDIPENEIQALEKTGKAQRTLQISAPRAGTVVEKMAVQGMKVDAGQKLYRIADLSTVWLMVQVYEQDLPFIKLKQDVTATLSYFPGRQFPGQVAYIFPWLDEKTRTVTVRLEFPNPGPLLKPGMYANIEISEELDPSVLLVPDMAVLRSGEKNTAFVAKGDGHFDPREVEIGLRSEGNLYQVLKGLDEGEDVVLSGQFMLDSESQLREAILKMLEPKAVKTESPAKEMPSSETGQMPGMQH